MKGRRWSITLFLSLLIILSTSLGTYGKNFSDMPKGWSKDAVEDAVANGLLKGHNGRIMPKEKLTRAEIATILTRLLGLEKKASIGYFTDVERDAWYYDSMAKAVEAGILKGRGKDKLDPHGVLTREEAFTIMARVFKLSEEKDNLSNFRDGNTVSTWAEEYVKAMVEEGYIAGGDKNTIMPKDELTREEFAQIVYNMIDGYVNRDLKDREFQGNLILNNKVKNLENITIHGDLIVGEGLSRESLKLKNVRVKGRLLVRSGKEVKIEGDSKIGELLAKEKIDTSIVVEREDILDGIEKDLKVNILKGEDLPSTIIIAGKEYSLWKKEGKYYINMMGKTIEVARDELGNWGLLEDPEVEENPEEEPGEDKDKDQDKDKEKDDLLLIEEVKAEDIEVDFNTSKEEAERFIEVLALVDGKELRRVVEVNWKTYDYKEDLAGEYLFIGSLEPRKGYKLKEGLSEIEVKVRVKAEKVKLSHSILEEGETFDLDTGFKEAVWVELRQGDKLVGPAKMTGKDGLAKLTLRGLGEYTVLIKDKEDGEVLKEILLTIIEKKVEIGEVSADINDEGKLVVRADIENAKAEDRAVVAIKETDIKEDNVEIKDGKVEIALDISQLEAKDYTVEVSVGEVKAKVEFTVREEVSEVTVSKEEVEVDFGTSKENLIKSLGYKAIVNGEECADAVEVKWESDDYNLDKAGTYTFTGKIRAKEGYKLAEGVKDLEVKVVVKEKEEPEEKEYIFAESLVMKAQEEGERAELKFSENMDKPVMVEVYEGEELVGEGGMTESPNFGTALVNLIKTGNYKLVVKDGEEELASIPLTVNKKKSNDVTLRLKGNTTEKMEAQEGLNNFKPSFPIKVENDKLIVDVRENLYGIRNAIEAPEGGEVSIVDSNGAEVTKGNRHMVMGYWKIKVVAEDGTEKLYSIEMVVTESRES